VKPASDAALVEQLDVQIDRLRASDWAPLLEAWRNSDAGRRLICSVDEKVRAGAIVYPAQVFRALECTPLHRVRVVILGQDPYHGPGQADGLAFSVREGQSHPPSLRNIFGELHRDLGLAVPRSGSLQPWATRGVLLLNTALTVQAGSPGSHSKLGWQVLTDGIIESVSAHQSEKVFMLWGAHAQAQAARLAASGVAHRVLRCNHPSPLSARRGPTPFIGCGHFAEAARFLGKGQGQGEGDLWRLSPPRAALRGAGPAQTVV
jgi:uracil-DNA glycosylase